MARLRRKVSLMLAVVLVFCLSLTSIATAAAPEEIPVIGSEIFQKAMELYPGLYDAESGMTQPTFRISEAITEDVWVEVPLDSDNDGMRDLIRIRIARPAGSGAEGFKVPVLLEHSPYRGNTINTVGGDYPFIEDVKHEQEINASTADYTYNDVASKKARAHEWQWTDDPFEVPGFFVPASRGAGETVVERANAVTNIVSSTANNINNQMFTRGSAVIFSSGLGNRYTASSDTANGISNANWNEGLSNTSDVSETICAMAVIKWLAGEARGYTDKTASTEVVADSWFGGTVAMSGQSYVATIPMAVASSGIDELTAIIPRAGINNWYEYFRANGGVFPGEQAQGEDAHWLSRYVVGRYNEPGFLESDEYAFFLEQMDKMKEDSDRITGDYNDFWDTGNYLATIDQWKAGVLFQQGFNDRNVGTQHMDELYRALKQQNADYPIKLQLHLQAHTTIFNMSEPEVLNVSIKWLDHFLWGIDNGIVDNGVEAWVADNVTGSWDAYSSWPVPGSEMRKYYFNATENGGQLLSTAPNAEVEGPFADALKYRHAEEIRSNPDDPYYRPQLGTDLYDIQQYLGNAWEDSMIDYTNLDKHSSSRLAYITNPLEHDVTLSGTAKVTLDITPDIGKGSLSVAVIDVGTARRGNSTVNVRNIPANTASGLASLNLVSYNPSAWGLSNYKVVTRASVDVQNPNPSGITYLEANKSTAFMAPFTYQTVEIVPGQSYQYTFTLEPRQYTFAEGHQLAVVVYSTDYRHTIMPETVTSFELTLGEGSFIELPLVQDLYETVAIETVEVESLTDNIYFGEAVVPEFALTNNGYTLVEGTDYLVQFDGGNNSGVYTGTDSIGSHTVSFTGIGYYSGVMNHDFEIVRAQPVASINAPGYVYLDENRTINYVITAGGIVHANVFEISGKIDMALLKYDTHNITVNLPAEYNASIQGGVNAKGEIDITIWFAGQGIDLRSLESVPLITLSFDVSEFINADDIVNGNLPNVTSTLDSVSITSPIFEDVSDAEIIGGVASTNLSKSILRYDCNDDGEFTVVDVGMIIYYYYLSEAGSVNWDEVVVYDIVADGIIDALDIIAFFSLI